MIFPMMVTKGYFTLRQRGRTLVKDAPNHTVRQGVQDFGHWLIDEDYLVGSTGPSHGGALYLGLIDGDSYSAAPTTDTMASHPGWTEIEDYDEASRPGPFTQGTVSLTTPSATTAILTFTPNTTLQVRGVFVTDDNTKGGSSGRLFAAAILSSAVEIIPGDPLEITYTLRGVFTTPQF